MQLEIVKDVTGVNWLSNCTETKMKHLLTFKNLVFFLRLGKVKLHLKFCIQGGSE